MRNKRLDVARCQGITQSGERCKKRGRFSRGFCRIHVSQAKKRGLGGYATFVGAAAATVTVIEKIVELLPYFTGHTPHHGDFVEELSDLLKDGRFRDVDQALIVQSRSLPQQLQQKARRQISQFHALQRQFDRLNESKRRELGQEISERLGQNKKG